MKLREGHKFLAMHASCNDIWWHWSSLHAVAEGDTIYYTKNVTLVTDDDTAKEVGTVSVLVSGQGLVHIRELEARVGQVGGQGWCLTDLNGQGAPQEEVDGWSKLRYMGDLVATVVSYEGSQSFQANLNFHAQGIENCIRLLVCSCLHFLVNWWSVSHYVEQQYRWNSGRQKGYEKAGVHHFSKVKFVQNLSPDEEWGVYCIVLICDQQAMACVSYAIYPLLVIVLLASSHYIIKGIGDMVWW